MALAPAARADWTDNFTGGQTQPWQFFDNNASSPPSDTLVVDSNNDLRLLGNPATFPGSFDQFAIGLVGVGNPGAFAFTDVRVQALVSRDSNISLAGTPNTPGNNDAFLLARSDGVNGYLLSLDFNNGDVDLVKSTGGALAGLGAANIAGFDPAKTYQLQLDIEGTDLVGKVFDGVAEVASIMGSDGDFAAGLSGLGAAINDDDSIGGAGGTGRTLIAARFDNVSSRALPIPEPASLALALAGIVPLMWLGYRRRRSGRR